MECFILLSRLGMGGEHSTLEDDKFLVVLREVLDDLDYHVSVAYDQYTSTSITEKTEKRVKDADLVIVDISDHNPAVFYCLGILKALDKPFIIIKSLGQPNPFSVEFSQVISIDLVKPKNWNNAKERLKDQISEVQSKKIKDAREINEILPKESKGVLEKDYSHLLDSLNELKNEIKKIPTVLNEPSFEKSYSVQTEPKEISTVIYPHQKKMVLLCKNCKKLFKSLTQMDMETYNNIEDFSRLEKCARCNSVIRYIKRNYEFVDSQQEL